MPTYAENLAQYATNLRFDDLPTQVVRQAKVTLRDSIACGVSGARVNKPWCKAALQLVRHQGGTKHATVWHFGDRTSDLGAAFINAMFAHSMDFNDDLGGVQIGAIVPMTALAVGEAVGASGTDVIAAMTIGYDLAARIAQTVDAQALFLSGIQPTAWIGGFAATAVAGRLLDQNVSQLAAALGIVASFAAGPMEFLRHGTDTKRFHPAKCAHSGVMAARLASFGMTGPQTIFEGEFGAFNALSGSPKLECLVADLGTRFEIMNTRIKPLPFADGNLGPLEGVLAIMQENGIDAESIDHIHCRVIPSLIPFVFEFHGDRSKKYRPVTELDAQTSLPFCLAVGILRDGNVTFENFDPSNYADPEIHKLADKVTAEGDSSLRGRNVCPVDLSTVVSLAAKNGETYTKRIEHHRGDPRNPMSDEELRNKFSKCVEGSFSESRKDDVLSSIDQFEAVGDVSDFAALLVTDVAKVV